MIGKVRIRMLQLRLQGRFKGSHVQVHDDDREVSHASSVAKPTSQHSQPNDIIHAVHTTGHAVHGIGGGMADHSHSIGRASVTMANTIGSAVCPI